MNFGLIAVDAAGGELLLGDGERVEHAGSLPRAGLGAKQRAAWADAGRLVQRSLPLSLLQKSVIGRVFFAGSRRRGTVSGRDVASEGWR